MAEQPTITVERLADLTGLTADKLYKLARSGFFPTPKKGQYLLTPALRGLFKFYHEAETKRVGRPEDRLAWTMEKACAEFPINPRTISARIKQMGIEPAINGQYYTTAQIAQAVYGDLEAERIRLTKEDADRIALQNAKARGELVSTEVVLRVYANLAVNVRQIIKHSGLSEVEKHELLKNIRELKVSDLLEEHTNESEAT